MLQMGAKKLTKNSMATRIRDLAISLSSTEHKEIARFSLRQDLHELN